MRESVGKRRRRRRKRTLARAERSVAAIHQTDLDARGLWKRKDGVSRPVPACDLPTVEGDLFVQREADRLNDSAFDLVFRAVRIDHESEIRRHHNAGDLYDACLAVDLHVHHCGGVHADAFIAAKGQAAAIASIALLPRSPTCLARCSFEYGAGAGVLEMSETERQWIDARDIRKLVHKAFDGKSVSVGSERPERSVADWRVKQQMVSDLLPRQFVVRYRIAIAVAEWLRNMRWWRFDKRGTQTPTGEKVHTAGLPGPHRMTIAPQIVRPVHDLPVGRKRRLELHRHSWSKRRPSKFVISHPLK